MGKGSAIEWTHHTFNPWWGCVRVSPGCEHCYAESFAKRVGQKVWGVQAPRRFFGDKHWAEPAKWNREAAEAGERRRVFCASMADVFEDRPELEEPRGLLFGLIEATRMLDWLLLTKRPENIARMLPSDWLARPRENIWLGTTAEDQRRADERIPLLLQTPAAVRFISAEPLLGPVDLTRWLSLGWCCNHPGEFCEDINCHGGASLDWVIVGGESGPGSRPFDLAWARSIVSQCHASGVPVFVKQLGAKPIQIFNAVERHDLPLHDRKGGDIAEFPQDLRVREFPA